MHQILIETGVKSAAEGINQGFTEAVNDLIVFAHQDVYFPPGWDQRIIRQARAIEQQEVTGWISGCIGYSPGADGARVTAGAVIDRDATLLFAGSNKRVEVQTLDELVLVMPKASAVRFDPELGLYFYGADLCLQNLDRGGRNFASYAPCSSNSQLFKSEFPKEFNHSAVLFENKWQHVPKIVTSSQKFH